MRPQTNQEEPETKAPKPETNEIGEEFGKESSIRVTLIAMWKNGGFSNVTKTHDARDGKSAGTNGHKLVMSVNNKDLETINRTMPGRAASFGSF